MSIQSKVSYNVNLNKTSEEVQLAMEEICNKEKELRALVHVTNVLYERGNEMQ